jgi:hypothetical protein
MSFIQCFEHQGRQPSAVFVNLNLVEVVYIDPISESDLSNVKIVVGGVTYDMFEAPVDNAKASNAILQVTGLKGK